MVLRTHTSPVQIRTMINQRTSFKNYSSWKNISMRLRCYHSPMFHQVEGLFINKSANMSDLKGTLIEFCEKIF